MTVLNLKWLLLLEFYASSSGMVQLPPVNYLLNNYAVFVCVCVCVCMCVRVQFWSCSHPTLSPNTVYVVQHPWFH